MYLRVGKRAIDRSLFDGRVLIAMSRLVTALWLCQCFNGMGLTIHQNLSRAVGVGNTVGI